MRIVALILIILSMKTTQGQDKSFKAVEALENILVAHRLELHSTVNKELFNQSLIKYSKQWKVAFDFLISSTNLDEQENGKIELLGEDVFATISEYQTKNVMTAKIEAHEIYADIQMVLKGKEQMGLVDKEDVEIVNSYNTSRDVEFYQSPKVKYHDAIERCIFIFLPGEIHQPGLQDVNSKLVKKLVIKVKVK